MVGRLPGGRIDHLPGANVDLRVRIIDIHVEKSVAAGILPGKLVAGCVASDSGNVRRTRDWDGESGIADNDARAVAMRK